MQQQLAHDGRNAVEVAWPVRAVQHIAKTRDAYCSRKALRVHDCDIGREQQMHTRRVQQFKILVFRAGIGIEILPDAKLFGIHKNCRDHPVGHFLRAIHEREVAFVQSAHGGHQRNRTPFATPGLHAAA